MLEYLLTWLYRCMAIGLFQKTFNLLRHSRRRRRQRHSEVA